MFVFFFGCLSMITPPVAMAAYAAGHIAQAPPMKVGWRACQLGWPAFALPFMFAWSPTLLLIGTPLDITIGVASATVGVWLGSAAIGGYFLRELGVLPSASLPEAQLALAGAGIAFVPTALLSPALAQQFQGVPPPAHGRSAQPVKPMPGPELLIELRKGGYVIYLRHTSTDFSRDDVKSRSDDDCDSQRPLTDRGREEARRIGAAFKELKIPVGTVLASARCRTMETAMLAFGRAEPENAVSGGPSAPDSTDRYAGLRKLFSTPLKPGANLVVASHGNPFYATAGAPYLAEGEAAVIRPLGKDFEIVARVRHDAWRQLMKRD